MPCPPKKLLRGGQYPDNAGQNVRIVKAITLVIFCYSLSCNNHRTKNYSSPPKLVDGTTISAGADTLQPVGLQFFHDTLYVSYYHRPQIDLLSNSLKKIGTIKLTDPEPIYPTSFVVTDSFVIADDHSKNIIVIYDRKGEYLTSFGKLPDNSTIISPFALAYYGGVLYASDISLGRILAISLADAPGITESGELVLTIPNDKYQPLKFPSSIMITPDGRLIAGDAGAGAVHVFTCDGRQIYDFDSIGTDRPVSPVGFAMDNVKDPALQDSTVFDPSGLPELGRIHVVDSNNSSIHIFNPLGRYAVSYGGNHLLKPSGIAIDTTSHSVFVADTRAKSIFKFKY